MNCPNCRGEMKREAKAQEMKEELGPEIEVYRNNRLVKVRATRCKKCGHFHSGGSVCGHRSYPFKEYPWIISYCPCRDLDTWDFIEQVSGVDATTPQK